MRRLSASTAISAGPASRRVRVLTSMMQSVAPCQAMRSMSPRSRAVRQRRATTVYPLRRRSEEGFALAGGAGFEVGGVAGCSRERGEAAKRPGLRADPHATRGADSFGLAHALQLKRFWRKERFGKNGGMCSVVERASNIARTR